MSESWWISLELDNLGVNEDKEQQASAWSVEFKDAEKTHAGELFI